MARRPEGVKSPPSTAPNDSETQRDRIKRALRAKRRVEAVRMADLIDAAHAIPPLHRSTRIVARGLKSAIVQINVLTDREFIPIAVHTAPGEDAVLWRARRHAGQSLCKYVVWLRQPVSISNAREDPRVRQSHTVRDLNIGAYLGVPVHAPASGTRPGPVIGTLCAVSHAPHEWTSEDASLLQDVSGAITDHVAYRIARRDAVRAADQQMARILLASGAGVLGTDANGVTMYANPAAEQLLGYTRTELVGHDQHALIHHSHADGSRYLESDCPNYQARREARTHHVNNDTFWRADGTPITVSTTMTPIIDRGEVIGSVLTFVDVSERRSREIAERDARLAAEAANRAKSEMLAALSHELRAPITAIGQHADRLEALLIDRATPEQRVEVRGIQRSQQFLSDLVNNVQGLAALESGGSNHVEDGDV